MGLVIRASDKQIDRVKPKSKFDDEFNDAIEKSQKYGSNRRKSVCEDWNITEELDAG